MSRKREEHMLEDRKCYEREKTYRVDFTLTGYVEIEAYNEDDAKERFAEMSVGELLDDVDNREIDDVSCEVGE